MEFRELFPIVLYDNKCYLCSKFAKTVNFLVGNRITFIGHYTKVGESIRERYLDDSALKMFWLIDKQTAFGGRSALIPLMIQMISRTKRTKIQLDIDYDMCDDGCKKISSVFLRSASLLASGKKIEIQ